MAAALRSSAICGGRSPTCHATPACSRAGNPLETLLVRLAASCYRKTSWISEAPGGRQRSRDRRKELPMTRTPHIGWNLPHRIKPARITPAKAVAVPLLALTLAAAGGAAQASPNLLQDPGFTP